ncbi:MAG: ATP-grasp domain-containing protein [Gammaproteobacteria bacterium]|nr:ATP-grasp domain-containing protein [Gammaproteobacteria bacterium]
MSDPQTGGPRRSPRIARSITVLLGDPRLSDEAKIENCYSAEDLEAVDRLKAALHELDGYEFTYYDDHTRLIDELHDRPPAFVLNFCDTGFRNNAFRELHVPAYLEMLGIPYTGATPNALGLCYDKSFVRAVAKAHGVPVPQEIYVSTLESTHVLPSVFPAIVKPSTGDGSIGITQHAVVNNIAEQTAYLERLEQELPGRDVLVQEFLSGTEYGVGLIGNPGIGLQALPPMEVDYSGLDAGLPKILSYESKSDPDSPYWSQIKYREAKLSEGRRQRLIDWSKKLFERLGCRDYARFDYRADRNGRVKLMEVNPNPAWCWDGKLNFMAGFAGCSYPGLLRMILEAAEARLPPLSGARSSRPSRG